MTGWTSGAHPVTDPARQPVLRLLPVKHSNLEVPALYGNTVVYSAGDGSLHHPEPQSLYTANVDTFRPHLIVTSKRGEFLLGPKISQHWIAWIDQTSERGWTIWAMRRGSTQRIMLESSSRAGLTPNLFVFPLIALSGDSVAWSQATCLNSCQYSPTPTWSTSVFLRHLPNGPNREIVRTAAPCNQVWPSLSSTLLVWHQEGICDGVTGTDVMSFDRRTSHMTRLTTTHDASEAAVNGTWVAWKQAPGRLSNGDIVLDNLRTGVRTVVSEDPRRCKVDPAACSLEPNLTSDVLSWTDHGGKTVWAYDLTQRKKYRLGSDKAPLFYGFVGPGSGRRVVWEVLRQPLSGLSRSNYVAVAQVP